MNYSPIRYVTARHIREIAVLFVLLYVCDVCFGPISLLKAQQKEARVVWMDTTKETRQQILNMAFPVDYGDGKSTKSVIVLRYIPSFHVEKQIVIRCGVNSQTSIDYSIASVQLQQVLRSHFAATMNPNVVEASKLMNVKQISIEPFSLPMDNLYSSLWMSLAESLNVIQKQAPEFIIRLDGTTYVLEFYDHGEKMLFEFGGPEIGSDSPRDLYVLPYVAWMININKEIEALARQ